MYGVFHLISVVERLKAEKGGTVLTFYESGKKQVFTMDTSSPAPRKALVGSAPGLGT